MAHTFFFGLGKLISTEFAQGTPGAWKKGELSGNWGELDEGEFLFGQLIVL